MLKLRTIGVRDYLVLEGEQRVGRIRFAAERNPGIWIWIVAVHLTGGLPAGSRFPICGDGAIQSGLGIAEGQDDARAARRGLQGDEYSRRGAARLLAVQARAQRPSLTTSETIAVSHFGHSNPCEKPQNEGRGKNHNTAADFIQFSVRDFIGLNVHDVCLPMRGADHSATSRGLLAAQAFS